ncbi:MAG: bactofilin family protein [Myxococcota bacterium]
MTSTFHIGPRQMAHGRLTGAGAVDVEGPFQGKIAVEGRVRVGEGAVVQGPVHATHVEIAGAVHGTVTATGWVRILAGGEVRGDVRSPRLDVDDAGRVRGLYRFDGDESMTPDDRPPAREGLRWEGEVRDQGDEGGVAPQMPRLGRRRGRWRGGSMLAAVIATGLIACAAHPLTLEPTPRAFTPDDYDEIYDAWTRDANEFELSELSEVLHVSATFESWEFRWAYVVRYAHDYSLSPEDRQAMLRATLADAQEHHRFFVTLAGRRFRESDLTGDRSAWRVLLVDPSGEQTVPVEIEKVRKPNAAERVYFESINPFRQAFRLVFPAQRSDGSPSIPPGADEMVLRFTGALGQVDLEWSFAGSSDS